MVEKTDNSHPEEDKLVLKLYVSGMSPKSMLAVENIKRLCKVHFKSFNLEIIDIYKNPMIASKEQIVFSPSLVKLLPLPRKTLIGNFSNSKRVLDGLGFAYKE
jgi:circadian clock protein KaiB